VCVCVRVYSISINSHPIPSAPPRPFQPPIQHTMVAKPLPQVARKELTAPPNHPPTLKHKHQTIRYHSNHPPTLEHTHTHTTTTKPFNTNTKHYITTDGAQGAEGGHAAQRQRPTASAGVYAYICMCVRVLCDYIYMCVCVCVSCVINTMYI
jgi:hypothetical protein